MSDPMKRSNKAMPMILLLVGALFGFATSEWIRNSQSDPYPTERLTERMAAIIQSELSNHDQRSSDLVRATVQLEMKKWSESLSCASVQHVDSQSGDLALSAEQRSLADAQFDAEQRADEILASAREGSAWTREDESRYLAYLSSLSPTRRQAKMSEATRDLYSGRIEFDPAYFEDLLGGQSN